MKELMIQKKDKSRSSRSFFDSWAGSYDWGIFQFWMRSFHRPIFPLLDFSRKFRILDVGCGTGEFLKGILQKDLAGKGELYGLDLSEKMLSVARKKLPPQVHLEKGDVHFLRSLGNYFDYVTSAESFHHYADQKKALGEMVRVCRPGGRIIVVDINFFLRPIHFLFEKMEPGCVKINSREEMRRIFLEAGVGNIQQKRNFLFTVITSGTKKVDCSIA